MSAYKTLFTFLADREATFAIGHLIGHGFSPIRYPLRHRCPG